MANKSEGYELSKIWSGVTGPGRAHWDDLHSNHDIRGVANNAGRWRNWVEVWHYQWWIIKARMQAMDGLSWWQGTGEKIWMAKIDDRENRRQSERWLIRYGWVWLMTGKSWGKGRRPSPSGGDQRSPRRTLRWPTMNIFPYSTRRSRQWWWWSLPDWQAEGPFLFCASGVLGANPARQVTDRTRDLLLGFGRCPFSDFIHTMFWIYQIRHATIIPLLLYQTWFWSS